MSIFALDKELQFPPVEMAQHDGLLAIGGDLSPERLLLAYKNGIFPWYSGEIILWWSPDPRFVLFPESLNVTTSMKKFIRKNIYEFTVNKAFREVIHYCKTISRPNQNGTWITDDIEKAYIKMHELGFAHSTEAWKEGKLIGGIYGVRLGKIFFGESMFSLEDNASKFAFINYIELLKKDNVKLIDCQVYTEHLESLGAEMIPRSEFIRILRM
jgi:leucyl/phenylalanyl-tRNA---protein transferase